MLYLTCSGWSSFTGVSCWHSATLYGSVYQSAMFALVCMCMFASVRYVLRCLMTSLMMNRRWKWKRGLVPCFNITGPFCLFTVKPHHHRKKRDTKRSLSYRQNGNYFNFRLVYSLKLPTECIPISQSIKTTCLILYVHLESPKQLLTINTWTPQDLWRCQRLVSGTKTLAADPLGPVSCNVGVCRAHPTAARFGLRS